MAKSYLEREHFYWLKVIIDGMLLAGSFLFVYFIKRSNVDIDPRFKNFFWLLMASWLVSTLFSRKFLRVRNEDYFRQVKPFLVSAVVLVALVSLGIYVLGWYKLSRFIVYGSIALFLVLENLYVSLRNYRLWRIGVIKSIPFAVVFFLMELLVISATFVLIYLFHTGTIELTENYLIMLMGLFFLWFAAALIIHKFEIRMDTRFINVIFPFWKSELIVIGLVTYFIYFLRQASFSRFIILGSLLVFSLAENLIVFLYFFRHSSREAVDDPIRYFRAAPAEFLPDSPLTLTPAKKMVKYRFPGSRVRSGVLKRQLEEVYLNSFPDVFRFLAGNIDLQRIDIHRSAFLFTRNPYNFEILRDHSLQFFLNLRKANDFRRINYNFIKINQKLKADGVYVGRFEGKQQQQERYKETYPLAMARVLLFFHFLFVRMLPKIPVLRKVYFIITKGRARAVSKAEILGRLVFCGFEILATEEIDHQTWFIAKKAKSPNSDSDPSYGLMFRQQRVGKNKKFIYMFKLRTMHPYSEYLHKYMLENHPLDDSGKIRNDFRMTGWGRFLRKFYLDELPMLFNWLKRDVKLVGVRPISQSFFNTYPKYLQKERIKYKPGLIPPYYADMPGNIEEVFESEREYLRKYSKHPWRTDFKYFWKAMNNIFLHKAKSS